MKRQRIPYAKRSLTYVVAALAAVLIVACILAGYEINHLHNQVSGLQSQVNNLYSAFLKQARPK